MTKMGSDERSTPGRRRKPLDADLPPHRRALASALRQQVDAAVPGGVAVGVVAELVPLPKSTLFHILSGKRLPSEKQLLRLLETLAALAKQDEHFLEVADIGGDFPPPEAMKATVPEKEVLEWIARLRRANVESGRAATARILARHGGDRVVTPPALAAFVHELRDFVQTKVGQRGPVTRLAEYGLVRGNTLKGALSGESMPTLATVEAIVESACTHADMRPAQRSEMMGLWAEKWQRAADELAAQRVSGTAAATGRSFNTRVVAGGPTVTSTLAENVTELLFNDETSRVLELVGQSGVGKAAFRRRLTDRLAGQPPMDPEDFPATVLDVFEELQADADEGTAHQAPDADVQRGGDRVVASGETAQPDSPASPDPYGAALRELEVAQRQLEQATAAVADAHRRLADLQAAPVTRLSRHEGLGTLTARSAPNWWVTTGAEAEVTE
ncbi:hypothetical protein P9869_35880 [Streptomyces ossamyceticus]|nr:hypothetical protein [Streptomyces ossamyceticus]